MEVLKFRTSLDFSFFIIFGPLDLRNSLTLSTRT